MKVYSPEENYKLSKIIMAAKIYKRHVDVEKVTSIPKFVNLPSSNILSTHCPCSKPKQATSLPAPIQYCSTSLTQSGAKNLV